MSVLLFNSEHVRKYPWTHKVIVMFRVQVGDLSGTVTLQTIRELERAEDGVRCGLAALRVLLEFPLPPSPPRPR